MRLLFVFLFAALSLFSNRYALNARIFLENNSGGGIVAFQKTSEKGKAAFQYLEEDNYSLQIIFPQQGGKYLKEKRRHNTLTKASYNTKNKTYFYQGKEGYFSVKFSGLKRIDSDSFKAVFRENKEDGELLIEIAQFQTRKDGAKISVQVKVLTAKQFKNATDKVGNDISMYSIQGIK